MNRIVWLGAAALVIIVVGAFVLFSPPRGPVQISTDTTQVSVGPGGVSVSVAPSAQ
jgi:hypothetical protein